MCPIVQMAFLTLVNVGKMLPVVALNRTTHRVTSLPVITCAKITPRDARVGGSMAIAPAAASMWNVV